MLVSQLGEHAATIAAAVERLEDGRVLDRIRARDHRVWSPHPDEIVNRLGWLDAPRAMMSSMATIRSMRDKARRDGFTHVVLLGMGGSSLFPEALAAIFPPAPGAGMPLTVIDSTDPDLIRTRLAGLDLATTLVIVATKSGGTVETLSAFRYLYNAIQHHGALDPGRQFLAITDPGSQLERLAEAHGFRQTFLNDPEIGGRYSALSHFGIVPAVLLGLDAPSLLLRGHAALEAPDAALELGAALGVLAGIGRDKLTLTASDRLVPFLDWIEQLVAESTGKAGRGIVPVVGEPLAAPARYGSDRVFVDLALAGDGARTAALDALAAVGHPVLRISVTDATDVGGQTMTWSLATVLAAALLGVQPFDQPDVESAKASAREMVAAFTATGALPAGEAVASDASGVEAFLAAAQPGDYLALQVYGNPTPELEEVLHRLRVQVRDRHRIATTLGWGPRFLHSTGQLHKGDGNAGLFVQVVTRAREDLPIPDRAGESASTMSFDTLKHAQAMGDARALAAAGRRVHVIHAGPDPADMLAPLLAG